MFLSPLVVFLALLETWFVGSGGMGMAKMLSDLPGLLYKCLFHSRAHCSATLNDGFSGAKNYSTRGYGEP